MDSDQGKLFIGGISWETSEEKLRDHFEVYGEVLQAVVMKDKATGRPRGFGFVVFANPLTLDRVLQDAHTIDGRTVDAKKAMSREEQQTSSRSGGSTNVGRSFGNGGNYKTKKIFVGGLPATLTEEEFRQYFEAYGVVTDAVIMYDQQTQRPRGFGFIVFEDEEAVDRVVVKNFHDLQGKKVEVKRAMPKDANPSGGGGGRSMGGGGYQGGISGGSYDGRKSLETGGGNYSSYGSGYNAPASYGYGAGGDGNYGMYNGYGGQAGAGYGNHNPIGAGYGSGAQGSWNGQAGSGYGGYGNGGGGNSAAAAAAMIGQSQGGYGNQGYGYNGGYGGNDESYGHNQATTGYGAVGGRGNGGYLGGGGGGYGGGFEYGGNQGWRNGPPSQTMDNGYGAGAGADNGYGSGYGDSSTQQVQQH